MGQFSKSQMPRHIFRTTRLWACTKYFIICFVYLITLIAGKAQDMPNIIGAAVDLNTHVGREERVSMELAIQDFNKASSNLKNLRLCVIDSGGNPLQMTKEAEGLVKDKGVVAIVGMATWLETTMVAEAARGAQIPVLSFAAPSFTPSLVSVRWSSLVKMASSDVLQMKCISSIVGSYGWSRVIIISEDDGYSTNSGIFKLLSDELGAVGSEIEHWLAFPPFSTLSDPKAFVRDELDKLDRKESRVFIVVGCSLELAIAVLTLAKHNGLIGKHSVWITTDSVANLLDAVDQSDMIYMEGILGIKTYFPKTNPSFKDFSVKFRTLWRSVYPEEKDYEPGFYAVRAYDAISSVALALDKARHNKSSGTVGKLVLDNILSSNIDGLSGKVQFEDGGLSGVTTYEIVNVVKKGYISLKYWSDEYGFSDNIIDKRPKKKNTSGVSGAIQVLGQQVHWPGDLQMVPLGWVMPTTEKPMIIGVPGNTTFEKFVKWKEGDHSPSGFCIDVFQNAVNVLGYPLPYTFKKFTGVYEDLLDQVYYENLSAAVGDITILANRSEFVEFTQPYAESGLTMVVPVKRDDKTWLIVKPFSTKLWVVVIGLFGYTTFVVWFLEHGANPEFRGPWKTQLSTTMWFTSSTLFFAHKESLHNSLTRVVMFIWLITVFIVTSSYTANLASMLTVKRLEPKVTDIDTLRKSNSSVGCDRDTFIRKYLEDVLHFHPNNIINITTEYEYPEAFKNGSIQAAFMELPYERVFLSRYPNDYQDVGLDHRFGGLGFAFPKGSPLAREFSKAFLQLTENGTLNEIHNYWFTSYTLSSNSDDSITCQGLGLGNFWVLFLVTGVTSTSMVVLYITQLFTKYRHSSFRSAENTTHNGNSIWSVIKRFGIYYTEGQFYHSGKDQISIHTREVDVFISSDDQRNHQLTPLADIQRPKTSSGISSNQPRVLRLSYSFPGRGT